MDAAKILIVDDQIDALRGVSRIMKGAGYETLEASNGTDCLRLAKENKPDLILLDVVLPDIDGMEVCKRIKSDPETANISVVLLSSIHTESDSQAKGLEYGADGYIARPIPNRELVARVKSILRLKYAEKEEIYRMFIDSAPAAMAMFDRHMRYIAVSGRWMTDYRLGDRDVLGQSHYEIFPEIPDHWKDVHQRGFQGEVIKVDEEEFKRQDGSIQWMRWEVRPWNWTDGQIGGIIIFTEDITDRKQAEDIAARVQLEVEESRDNFRDLYDFAPIGYFTLTQARIITGVNLVGSTLLGMPRSELIGQAFERFIAPENLFRWHEHLLKARLDGVTQSRETSLKRQDGSTCYVSLESLYLKSPTDRRGENNGGPVIRVAVVDITTRKLAEENLRQSELRLNRAELIAGTGYWEIDLSTKKVTASGGARTIYGVEDQELTLNDIQNFPLPEYRSRLDEALLRLIRDGKPYDVEFKMKRANDDQVTDIHSISHHDTEKNSVFGTIHDITNIRHAEESHRLLVRAMEQAAEGVVITDAAGVIQYVNPAEENITGYNSDELIGRKPSIFKSNKQDQKFYKDIWNTINAGNVWSGRFINRRKDGTEYHEDNSISPVYNRTGKLTNFVAVKHDVTKQIEIQEQLFQSQKMEAIGTLAGGFAHDFNNKLQVVAGYVELILYNKDLPEALISDLDQIKQTVDSCSELIKGMMVFSRKTPVGLQPIELNKIVEQTRSMLARSIPRMIEIQISLADDIWTINAVPNQIDQILMNLAINAGDAMPDGGKLTIKTRNIVLDEDFCRRNPETKPGKYALITVSDTGTGMNKDTASHIFEPFFTTKEAGKGTGLGLAVVYEIVEQHGGRIVCESEPSVGTTFSIYLPAIEELPQEQCSEKKESPIGQRETILLVDDEPDIIKIGSLLLTNANYRVITASDGEEALKLYQKHHEEIKLVILDIVMPKLGGEDCLRALLALDPEVRVLIATGALTEGMARNSREAGAKGFVRKPFDMHELLTMIREILDILHDDYSSGGK